MLDSERFIAGHAYRVNLRHGSELVGSTLVYCTLRRCRRVRR